MIPALLLGSLLACSAVMAPLDPQFRDENMHLNASLNVARAAVGTEKCQLTLDNRFPEYGKGADWQALFQNVNYAPTDPIAGRESVAAFVHCDVSLDTVMMVRRWYLWGSRKRVANYMVHEFVHLLTCPRMLQNHGSQGDTPAEVLHEYELMAREVAAICVGE